MKRSIASCGVVKVVETRPAFRGVMPKDEPIRQDVSRLSRVWFDQEVDQVDCVLAADVQVLCLIWCCCLA